VSGMWGEGDSGNFVVGRKVGGVFKTFNLLCALKGGEGDLELHQMETSLYCGRYRVIFGSAGKAALILNLGTG